MSTAGIIISMNKYLLLSLIYCSSVFAAQNYTITFPKDWSVKENSFGADYFAYSPIIIDKDSASFFVKEYAADIKDPLDFIQNDKTIITPYELDFYLPEYNLAIEMNGDHWHSDKFKDKLYHYNKWKWCKERNIKLLTIFETEWYAKSDIIKNIIKNNIGINNNKIHGRKFIIKRIDTANYRNMVEKYHIQGFVSGIAYYGGFIGDEIKAAMCFSYTRGNKENRRFELRRWVSDFGIYPGLFSKIFKFAKIDLNFTNVVSFSDNRWFDGKSYEKIGFKKGAEIGPAYHYLYRNEVVHCSRFTKNNILKKFPEIDFNDCSTETEMMTKIGIPKIWDCGKQEWIYETII